MTTERAFVTLDVFTDRVFGGNPLAVLADAHGLETTTLQSIAREFNLSETTFVSRPDDPSNTHKVRIFTPVAELEFAGHPTLGTAIALALDTPSPNTDSSFLFEEGVGVVPVSVTTTQDGLARAEFSVASLPKRSDVLIDSATWAQLLGLEPNAVCPDGMEIGTWSCGAAFDFVPVADLEALAKAKLNNALWSKHAAHSNGTGQFVFTLETKDVNVDVRARMFAPEHGIPEDPATGSAVAALAGWLAAHTQPPDGTQNWIIEQGVEMGRPSRLELAADIQNGCITAVRVAGTAVPVSRGTITIP